MIDRPHRQEHVEDVVLEALSNGAAKTTQEITSVVRRSLELNEADLVRANKRTNEAKIDQIIANALQEKRRLCRTGMIERVSRGVFRITQAGQSARQKLAKDIDEIAKIAIESGIDFSDD